MISRIKLCSWPKYPRHYQHYKTRQPNLISGGAASIGVNIFYQAKGDIREHKDQERAMIPSILTEPLSGGHQKKYSNYAMIGNASTADNLGILRAIVHQRIIKKGDIRDQTNGGGHQLKPE